ncbi:unnamed protein product [marine sediment metagenome]|uniref:Uncharacterized protein n=1 Tax=marine sediment metagenome TaxID=412755 RepID=X1QE80_9ZZZZ
MASGHADYSIKAFTSAVSKEQIKIIAGPVEATNSFAQEVKSILIYNDGVNPCHVEFDDTATLNHIPLPAKSWLIVDLNLTDVHTICAVGHAATLYCIGLY